MTTTFAPNPTASPASADDMKSARRRHRLRRIALGTIIAGATTIPALGVHAERSNSTDFTGSIYVTCMRSAAGTADSLERYVDVCVERAAVARPAFESCLKRAARTPDALEHWVESCAGRALSARA